MLVAAALVCGRWSGAAAQPSAAHLEISGTQFTHGDGRPFAWRGITAFRLVELVAHGREREADAYLAWAGSMRLTVVRVLVMADLLFTLSPADGQHALPRLLDLAQKHGLHVEAVALADTARIPTDMPRHVKAIGAVCGSKANCLLEIANEPTHPTQAAAVHDPAYVQSLAGLVPHDVPVALGSVESGEGYGMGAYVTWHAPRSNALRHLDEGLALLRRYRKPVVSDEPIGAADVSAPGRRENDPQHFRELAAKTTRLGLGATFHYESGLQAKLPSKIELACLTAWLEGLGQTR